MSVKSYHEAMKAIQDIVFDAKIPIITMVAILEVTKQKLLIENALHQKEKEAKEFFDKLQECAEEASENAGVH